ncbi:MULTISPECIES: hypothetical protein [Microbacterium]|uniref:hypothetical protein n=1 Tax=Microbacterium TaxID=33882 RepID=UPI001469F951|nr:MULTISPECIES: hypothetical protein [Microbacterium]
MSIRLFRHEALVMASRSADAVRQRVRAGELIRVRRGVYADADSWRTARPEDVVVARARAVHLTSSRAPVFSHETAAALHGLPLFRPDLVRSHVILGEARPGGPAGTVRHRGVVTADEVVEIDGLRCTSLARTVADLSRCASFDQAVVVADAALRVVGGHARGSYDRQRAEAFVDEVSTCARDSAHGRGQSDRVMRFADGRAELPGESISRIRLREMGFREIQLQVAVPGPGTTYFVDFGLAEAKAFGEFDGRLKYVDGRLTRGLSSDEVFDREKRREDWIRGTTQRRLVRWGWGDLASAETLARRLAAFGIEPPRRA